MSFPTGLIILILIFLLWICGLLFYVFPDKRHASRSRRWGGSLGSGPPFKQRPLLKHIAFLLNPNSLPLRRLTRLRTRFGTPVIPTKRQNALNKGEGRLLTLLDRVVPEIFGPTARVCPQVSYGEFLSCSRFSKFARMNSRRADFVVITDDHRVALVVELQGSGHFGSTSKSARKAHNADRIKRSAMSEAGIPFLEVSRSEQETAVKSGILALIASIATSRPATAQQKGYNHV